MRKTWQKPKLVVLVRGRPEEHVLGTCKVADSSGPYDELGVCNENETYCGACELVNGT